MVANVRGEIPVTVAIDDRCCEARTTYSWSGGGAVLTLSTVLPAQDLAAELISTYVGHADTPTIATHLMLGPIGHEAGIHTAEHAHERLDPVESARECAYDHAHQLAAGAKKSSSSSTSRRADTTSTDFSTGSTTRRDNHARRQGACRTARTEVDQLLLAIPAAEYARVIAGVSPNRAGKIHCLFHDDHTPSLQLYDDGTWYCYGSCQAGGSIFDFAARAWQMRPEGPRLPQAPRPARRHARHQRTPGSCRPSRYGHQDGGERARRNPCDGRD